MYTVECFIVFVPMKLKIVSNSALLPMPVPFSIRCLCPNVCILHASSEVVFREQNFLMWSVQNKVFRWANKVFEQMLMIDLKILTRSLSILKYSRLSSNKCILVHVCVYLKLSTRQLGRRKPRPLSEKLCF